MRGIIRAARGAARPEGGDSMVMNVFAALVTRDGCQLHNPLVWARFVVEGDVFDQHAAQMALVDD